MSDADTLLPPLRDVIETHELSAKKSFGQNFILDLNLTRKIARAVPNLERSLVVEVGPGPGGLTRALLMEGAAAVYSIEADNRCLPALEQIQNAYGSRFQFEISDALAKDIATIKQRFGDRPMHICANLPYNIGTALLTNWMTSKTWPPAFQSLTLMFQREVAERITAKKGSKAYGRLSILCNWRSNTRILFDLAPSAFTPPPKVRSSVVQITPTAPLINDLEVEALGKLTELMFGQRRKMLRASLKRLEPELSTALNQLNIDETMRPEALDVKQIADLALALQPLLLKKK